MTTKQIKCRLDREPALHLERRYGIDWGDGVELDDAQVGESNVPDITFTIEFESQGWPREALLTMTFDEDAYPNRYEQLTGNLQDREVAHTEL